MIDKNRVCKCMLMNGIEFIAKMVLEANHQPTPFPEVDELREYISYINLL